MVPVVLLVGDATSFVQAVVVLPCRIFSMRIIPNAERDGGFGPVVISTDLQRWLVGMVIVEITENACALRFCTRSLILKRDLVSICA